MTSLDLIGAIEARANAGRHVRLTPQTALEIARVLRAANDLRQHREAVTAILCTIGCQTRCTTCVGKSNLIIRKLVGERGPFEPSDAPTGRVARLQLVTTERKEAPGKGDNRFRRRQKRHESIKGFEEREG